MATKDRDSAYNPLLKSYPDSDKINAVSEGAEVLYVRLVAASDDGGRYPADPAWVLARLFTLRMTSGLKEKAIADRLDELSRVGLIEIYAVGERRYLQIVNVFRTLRKDVKPRLVYPEPCDASVTHPLRARPASVTDPLRTRYGHGPLDQTHTITRPDQEPDPHQSPAGRVRSSADDSFERFWKAFPSGRKQKPGNARAKWAKAITKADPEVIIAAAAEYAASPVGQGKFVSGPEPWLNAEQWNDDRAAWQRKDDSNGNRNPRSNTPDPRFEFVEDGRAS